MVVVDVGAGTGANRAYLAPRLAVPSRWVLLDRDRQLLAGFPEGGKALDSPPPEKEWPAQAPVLAPAQEPAGQEASWGAPKFLEMEDWKQRWEKRFPPS